MFNLIYKVPFSLLIFDKITVVSLRSYNCIFQKLISDYLIDSIHLRNPWNDLWNIELKIKANLGLPDLQKFIQICFVLLILLINIFHISVLLHRDVYKQAISEYIDIEYNISSLYYNIHDFSFSANIQH